jgi:hypothetical protein
MNELALVAVRAFARCFYMPLFAHFGFVVLMRRLLLKVKLAHSMSVGTLVIELTNAFFHEILTQLCFVVYAKVFNILDHFLSA